MAKKKRRTTEEQKEKLKILFKKHKGLIRKYYSIAQFKEPVVLLMRRGNMIEFLEGETGDHLDIEHSNGENRKIILNQSFLYTFDYGKRSFRGYICHEDHPIPIPYDPLVMCELFGVAIDKTLNDVRKWKIKEIQEKTNFWWTILIGLAILVALVVVYLIAKPTPPQQTIIRDVAPIIISTYAIRRTLKKNIRGKEGGR